MLTTSWVTVLAFLTLTTTSLWAASGITLVGKGFVDGNALD